MPDIYVAPSKKPSKPSSSKKKKTVKKTVKKKKFLNSLKGRTTNPLAAFMAHPRKVKFETQEKKEKIVLLLRRHVITNLSWLTISFVLLLAPFTLFKVLPFDFLPPRYRLVITLLWFLMVFAFTFERFLTWFFNVNIITDERIVDLDFPSILYKDTSETKIDQVQDISVKVGGYSRSLFNYGDVHIQTAGAVPQICFEAIPNPEKVARVLNELKLEEEQEKLEGRVR